MAEQNFANHTRLVPMFHYFILPALTLNLAGPSIAWHTGAIGWRDW